MKPTRNAASTTKAATATGARRHYLPATRHPTSASARKPKTRCHRPSVHKSETATFANGWLTKMIKARLQSQQSGPD
jgi:hypothetical protein